MEKFGILVDWDWCTGCHTCEVACQMEHGFPVGQTGVKIVQIGPWEYGDEKWQFDYAPIFTDQCNLCSERRALGKEPTCVQHCQSQCLKFGPLESLEPDLADHAKQMLVHLK